jgi:hypothetical protein
VIPSGLDVLGWDALHPVLGLEIEIEDRSGEFWGCAVQCELHKNVLDWEE